MAKSNWSYLERERRTGEYEEMTVRSIGHWSIADDKRWPREVVDGYHLSSETGVGMIGPTALHIADGAIYRDRHKLTYRSYILQQDNEEKKLDAIFESAKSRLSDLAAGIPESIRARYIPAMRHLFWGLGMSQIYGSAYTAHGTVMNSLLFQVFDSMRHAQRLVELSWQINLSAATEPIDSREIWLEWKPVQGLRKYIEQGLTVFDWGESLVAFDFVFNPIFQPVHNVIMVDIPEVSGDWAISHFWLHLSEDVKRHLVAGEDFVAAMLKEDERNRDVIQGWILAWYWRAVDAIEGLRPVVEEGSLIGFDQLKEGILARYSEMLLRYGLETPSHQTRKGERHDAVAGISR